MDTYNDHEMKLCKSSRVFYRFQHTTDNRIDKLQSGNIWISDPEKFNDPLDLNIKLRDAIIGHPVQRKKLKEAATLLFDQFIVSPNEFFFDDQLIKTLQQFLSDYPDLNGGDEIEKAVTDRMKKYGVVCLTPIIQNPLMWSHYAENHKGFAVEYAFDLPIIQESWTEQLVEYTSSLPTPCITEIFFTPHKVLNKLIATKSSEWAYEKELRLIHKNMKGKPIELPKNVRMTALIAGQKMVSDDIDRLKRKGKEFGIPIFQMKTKSFNYDTYPCPIKLD